MRRAPRLSKDGKTLTVRVPMELRKHGGRKLIIAPDGGTWAPPRSRIDNTMVRALARAHRWKRLLESGEFGSIVELANAENVNTSYLCRILRLTLLAPEIVEAILDGRQPAEITLALLMEPFSINWLAQHHRLLAIE